MLYDKDIREPLFDFLEETYGKVRILEEKRTGRSRADVVMVTEKGICGIEIKSDADSYARLEGQVADYDCYYDKNCIVVGTTHAQHVDEHVPDWWGIITVEQADDGPDFYLLRAPESNPLVDPRRKISLLWRPELAHIQEKNGTPKYPGKSKAAVAEMLLERVPEEVLWPQVYEELFERDYTTIAEQINAYRKAKGQKPRRKRRYKRVKKA